jgi:predicted PurR-regulated permease PerM
MEEKNTSQTLDISWGTIIKIAVAILGIYFIYQISEILVWIVFAFIISILFSPLVGWLRKIKIPHYISVIIVYTSVFGLVSVFAYLTVPVLYAELKILATDIPKHIESISPYLHYVGFESVETMEDFTAVFFESFEKIMANIFSFLGIMFGGFFSATFIIILAFFISLERNTIEKAVEVLSPENKKDRILSIWKRCRDQVSRWFLIRLLAGAFVGLSSYIAFYFLGVEYALFFAVVGGVLNIVPYIGSVIAGLVFFAILVLTNPVQAFFVIVAFTVIQTIEGAVTPYLSEKIMGVSSVIVLIAITIGGMLWGTLGAILAIPLLGIIFEFTKGYLENRKRK